ncbi:formylglycine-generating enzyme family protein [Cecembia lonarensis]|uniref:Serine/threonine-protein kinase pkn1 n=1 Tax=Cecembia lonarensis (strain CCUG 58316 / KCTC 22772 / LW9) TaxID=1225176 RepID=K1LL63_CECL9|nr:SUMF1/EgtB/PvdO family nonheme iron enzyme [Cecembia lonarensis]EKB51123.1 Serine/threonine-protein kinase pkn1 [Cecembia lonarensis LW9]
MKKAEALAILKISEDASPTEIKNAFEKQYEAAKRLAEHAPLASQKHQYRQKMSLYWQAYASLVDIQNPANLTKFSGTKENAPIIGKSDKTGQIFQQEHPKASKNETNKLHWKPVLIIILLIGALVLGWQYLNRVPEPVKQLIADMEYISGGTFEMGCTPEQFGKCAENEKPAHAVSLSSFNIGKFEVTRAQWVSVMKYLPKTDSPCKDPRCLIVNVTWEEVKTFIQKLNKMTGQAYRLPTEAEWEYAARGGNSARKSIFAGSNQQNQVAKTSKAPYIVGTLRPNEKQLFDMSGNVWEWCADGFDAEYYKKSPKTDPQGKSTASCKVIRGGSFQSTDQSLRVSSRNCLDKDKFSNEVGFRLAISFNR